MDKKIPVLKQEKNSREEIQAHLIYLKKGLEMKWEEIAQLPPMLGRIPIGTLSAIMGGRDPQDPIQREILGMEQNPNCGHCWRFNKYIETAIDDNKRHKPKITRWRDLPTDVLAIAIKYRS